MGGLVVLDVTGRVVHARPGELGRHVGRQLGDVVAGALQAMGVVGGGVGECLGVGGDVGRCCVGRLAGCGHNRIDELADLVGSVAQGGAEGGDLAVETPGELAEPAGGLPRPGRPGNRRRRGGRS